MGAKAARTVRTQIATATVTAIEIATATAIIAVVAKAVEETATVKVAKEAIAPKDKKDQVASKAVNPVEAPSAAHQNQCH